MAMKCIDQMETPMATAAAPSHTSRVRPMWERTRRNRSSAVHDPNTATSSDRTTKIGWCRCAMGSESCHTTLNRTLSPPKGREERSGGSRAPADSWLTARMGNAVDFGYLETFAAGDRGVVRDVLGLFLEQAKTWEIGLARPDAGWRDLVHTIKGTSRGIGAHELGDLAERAETEGPEMTSEVLAALNA